MKSLKEYLSMDYPITIKPVWEDEDRYWKAFHPDLPGCEAFGETPEESIAALSDIRETWFEIALENDAGISDSPPLKKSGRMLLRIPPDLHEQVQARAESRGTSLNTFLIYLLTNNLKDDNFKDVIDEINDKLGFIKKKAESTHCLYEEGKWEEEDERTSRDSLRFFEKDLGGFHPLYAGCERK